MKWTKYIKRKGKREEKLGTDGVRELKESVLSTSLKDDDNDDERFSLDRFSFICTVGIDFATFKKTKKTFQCFCVCGKKSTVKKVQTLMNRIQLKEEPKICETRKKPRDEETYRQTETDREREREKMRESTRQKRKRNRESIKGE